MSEQVRPTPRNIEDYLLDLRKAIDNLFWKPGRTESYLEARRCLALVDLEFMDLLRRINEQEQSNEL